MHPLNTEYAPNGGANHTKAVIVLDPCAQFHVGITSNMAIFAAACYLFALQLSTLTLSTALSPSQFLSPLIGEASTLKPPFNITLPGPSKCVHAPSPKHAQSPKLISPQRPTRRRLLLQRPLHERHRQILPLRRQPSRRHRHAGRPLRRFRRRSVPPSAPGYRHRKVAV